MAEHFLFELPLPELVPPLPLRKQVTRAFALWYISGPVGILFEIPDFSIEIPYPLGPHLGARIVVL